MMQQIYSSSSIFSLFEYVVVVKGNEKYEKNTDSKKSDTCILTFYRILRCAKNVLQDVG